MATDDETDGVTPEPEPQQDASVSHAVQLRIDVTEEIKRRESAGEVRKQIVMALADAEMKTRVDKLTKAFAKRNQMSGDLNKLRPDVVTYNLDGSKATESFSKDQLDKRRKATEELGRLDKAIGKAVDKADYGDLQKFIGG